MHPRSKAARTGAPLALSGLLPLLLQVVAPAQVLNPRVEPAAELTLRQVLTAPASLFEFLPDDRWVPGSRRIARIHPSRRDRVTAFEVGGSGEAVWFTAAQVNGALAAAGGAVPQADAVPVFTCLDGTTIRVQDASGCYHWKVGSPKARKVLALPGESERMAIAANDSRVAFVKDHQLFVQVGDGKPVQLTSDGSEDVVYGGAAHRVEFGIQDGLWWSPDGRRLAFYREDLSPITPYPYVDHTTMPPKALHGRYPMAGGANSFVQVGVYDVDERRLVYLEKGTERDIYWTNTTFGPDGALHLAIVDRGQDHMELCRFDPATGKHTATLFEERDPQWVEPQHGPIFLPGTDRRMLWFSPRDGYRHLYLYDGDGKLLRQATKGAFDIHEFVGFAANGERAYVMASGANPLEMHLFEVGLGDGAMRQVTRDRGQHTCVLSGDGSHVLDSFSNLQNPGQSQVIEIATGKVAHVTRVGHRFPVLGTQEFFTVAAEDGTKLFGTIILPPGLDPKAARKYPALLYVYGGPHSQLVQDRWLGGSSVWLHYMATQGYVVCTLDNRGTDNRGIEFAQCVHRRLGELEAKDQLLAVGHLRSLPFVDGGRIGVHGWSYGGFMTINLMVRSPRGTFACGASGAPVTTWSQYETIYTERYMDTPAENPDGYRETSVIPRAGKLSGRLLIVHGTDDKTVMWSHSLAFVDRCIDSGVLVDYLPYPMQKHGIGGPDRVHLYRSLTRFFDDQLRPGGR